MNSVETGQYEVGGRKARTKIQRLEIHGEEKIKGENRLSCLPDDLMKIIAGFLNPVDYLNFRCVINTCRLLLPPQIGWRKAHRNAPPLSPWFVWYNNHSGINNFVDSKLGGKYLISIPESLANAKIVYSKRSWLLMLKSLTTLFFYNPFTAEILELPKIPTLNSRNLSIGFSSSPKSSECVVIMTDIYRAELYILQVGKNTWGLKYSYSDDDSTYHFLPPMRPHCPIFHDNCFYVLGACSNLRVGYLNRNKLVASGEWVMGGKPSNYHSCDNFLLECNGKLLLVLLNEEVTQADAFPKIKVFTLNRAAMCWDKVDNLGNYTLYLSVSSSFSTPAIANWMRNIIFLPRLLEGQLVYYSIDTKKYHTHASGDDEVEYFTSREKYFHLPSIIL